MKRQFALLTLILVAGALAAASIPAQTRRPEPRIAVVAAPDLKINEYLFASPGSDSKARSYIVAGATGQGTSAARSAAVFSLVAASFKNGGGNYDHLLSSDKVVFVHVANAGNSATTPCRLKLTVTKINGATTSREKVGTVPALAAHKDTWVAIDAAGILPNNVALETTSFKLEADATKLLAESDESNNEVSHQATAVVQQPNSDQGELTGVNPQSAAQRRRIIEGYSAEFYAGNRIESGTIVGTCNSSAGCDVLKAACSTMSKHDFKDTEGGGICVDTANRTATGTFFLKNTNAPDSAPSAGNNEAGSQPAKRRRRGDVKFNDITMHKAVDETLNCEGAVMCGKVKKACVTLRGTYTQINDLEGACRH